MTYIPIMWLLSSNKLIIQLDQPTYKPWDTIRGKISCAFSEKVKIDSLSITLIWEKKYTNYSLGWSGWASYSSSRHLFFNERRTLLGPGEYNSQEVPFEFMIPATILPKRFWGFWKLWNLPEWVSVVLNIAINLFGIRNSQYTLAFSLNASADIPWGIDINENIYVWIEEPETSVIDIPVPTTDNQNPSN